jgi:YHS domain-containing protein
MGMATDPVCYAEVDEERATHTATYKDQTYYFCTASCRKKFEEKPEKYVKLGPSFKIDPGMTC